MVTIPALTAIITIMILAVIGKTMVKREEEKGMGEEEDKKVRKNMPKLS
jgi:uncharacterized membrane protein